MAHDDRSCSPGLGPISVCAARAPRLRNPVSAAYIHCFFGAIRRSPAQRPGRCCTVASAVGCSGSWFRLAMNSLPRSIRCLHPVQKGRVRCSVLYAQPRHRAHGWTASGRLQFLQWLLVRGDPAFPARLPLIRWCWAAKSFQLPTRVYRVFAMGRVFLLQGGRTQGGSPRGLCVTDVRIVMPRARAATGGRSWRSRLWRAPSRGVARGLAADLAADWQAPSQGAVPCLAQDLVAGFGGLCCEGCCEGLAGYVATVDPGFTPQNIRSAPIQAGQSLINTAAEPHLGNSFGTGSGAGSGGDLAWDLAAVWRSSWQGFWHGISQR